ncbi:hypothetical protein NPIL_610621 [Nephila pilipes]|uniref:Uncharacterized protein n=1 Tax=Nephila pilipes TaxID=299642 RepID=A0A8X6QPK2_NEPPI|nr:hypothetical protein NPIL_610621 [Nephila pilipes]
MSSLAGFPRYEHYYAFSHQPLLSPLRNAGDPNPIPHPVWDGIKGRVMPVYLPKMADAREHVVRQGMVHHLSGTQRQTRLCLLFFTDLISKENDFG